MFGLDDYGMSLQPSMTPELRRKNKSSVNEAYNSHTKQRIKEMITLL